MNCLDCDKEIPESYSKPNTSFFCDDCKGFNKPNKNAKIYCPHCYKIIDLEMDREHNLFVIEENEV